MSNCNHYAFANNILEIYSVGDKAEATANCAECGKRIWITYEVTNIEEAEVE